MKKFLNKLKTKYQYKTSQNRLNSCADIIDKLDDIEAMFLIEWIFSQRATNNPEDWESLFNKLSRQLHLHQRGDIVLEDNCLWPVNPEFDVQDYNKFRYAKRAIIEE